MIVIVHDSTVLGRDVYGKGKHDVPKEIGEKLIKMGLARRFGLPEVRTVKKKADEVVDRSAKRTVKQRRKRSRSKKSPSGKS